MKKILLFSLFLLDITFSQTITWSEITSNYTLPPGIKIFQGDRSSPKLKIFYIDVDMNNPDLVIHPYIGNTNKTVKDFVPFVGAYAGVNGGFFGGTNSLSAVVYPYEVKAQNVPSVTRFSQSYPVIRSFFGMKTDRSFSIEWIYHYGFNISDIYRFDEPMGYTNNQQNPLPVPLQSSGTTYQNLLIGIGGAPTLVKNGQITISYDQEIMWGSGVGYDNRDPRTAVGFTPGNHVIMITADGRQTASEGVGLPELAQIMIDLGCIEAMNLDGGGSAQMAAGNVNVNTPSEQREVTTILTVTHKDSLKLPSIPQFEKIIDTGDPEAGLIGSGWFASANPGYWPPTPAQLHSLGNGDNYAEFRPQFPAEAQYELYAWWVAASNRCQDTPIIVKHKDGTDTVRVNQTLNDARWNRIGNYTFSQDTLQRIFVSDAGSTGTYVVADAIKLISYDPATEIKSEDEMLPDNIVLYPNFPNPFNPVTNIKYSVPNSVKVEIKIFDMLGREIQTLVDKEKSSGIHELNWNASKLSSGIYYCRMKAGIFTRTSKMILMK